MLRKVLVGRLRCEGFVEVERRGYRFAGQGTFGRPWPAKRRSLVGVTPAGHDNRWTFQISGETTAARTADKGPPAPILAVAGVFLRVVLALAANADAAGDQ